LFHQLYILRRHQKIKSNKNNALQVGTAIALVIASGTDTLSGDAAMNHPTRQARQAVAIAMLCGVASGVVGVAQADSSASDIGLVFERGTHSLRLVEDRSLENIRGRYVPETSIASDGVILWDERPGRGAGGGGGRDGDHRLSNGLNNIQRVNVTTQRDR